MAAGGAGGVLGPLRAIDVRLLIPAWVFGGANIRFQEQLAGAAWGHFDLYLVYYIFSYIYYICIWVGFQEQLAGGCGGHSI